MPFFDFSDVFAGMCLEKSLVLLKIFAESVLGAAGVNTGAVGVDAKLIVVLESVELNFPMGWVISAFQCTCSSYGVNLCFSSVILTNYQATMSE